VASAPDGSVQRLMGQHRHRTGVDQKPSSGSDGAPPSLARDGGTRRPRGRRRTSVAPPGAPAMARRKARVLVFSAMARLRH
jgi:hypothetical protein